MKQKNFLLFFFTGFFISTFISAQSTTTICAGSQLCISGYSTGVWDGPGVSSQTALCINPSATGTYSCQTIDLLGSLGPLLTYSVTIADKPLVTFTSSAPALCGGSYTFTGNTSVSFGSITSRSWKFGDGTLSSATIPVYNYASAGNYSVTLIAQSSEGCTDSVIHTVNVSGSPNLSFIVGSICPGIPTTFTNTSSSVAFGNISSYSWDFGNGNSSTVASPVTTYTSAAVYPVTLTATTTLGCATSSIQNVSVYPIPLISFSTTNLCSRKLISFIPSAFIASGNVTNYSWLFSSSSGTLYNTSSTNPSYTFAPGNYPIVLTVISDHGCTATTTQTVTVAATPTAAFATQVTNSCSTTFSFNYTGSGSTSNSWNYDGTTTGTFSETTFTYPSPGSYTASAIGVSGACSDTVTHSFIIYPPPTLNFTYSNTCMGSTFSITSTPSASITSRLWDFGDPASGSTNTSTALSPSHVYTASATYSFNLTLTNSVSCVSQNTGVVTIYPKPFISVSSGSICSIVHSFTINPTGASTYTYLNGAAVVSPTTASTFSVFTYSVVGTSSLGCVSSNTAVSSVTVFGLPTISVPNATICLGSTYTFTGTGASYFSPGGGISTVSPVSTTSYYVVGISPQGCQSFNLATMTLVVNPVPFISVNSGTICAGKNFTMLPVSSTSTFAILGGTNVVSPTVTTSYTATTTNSLGCVSNAISTVNVLVTPSITVNSGTICSGASFILAPSGAVSYTYSGSSPTVVPLSSTDYTVFGTGVSGCTNSAVSSLTVYITPTITVNSGSICSGKSFTLLPAGAASYSYSGGSQVISPAASTSISVTGISPFGCTNTAISHVTFFVTPTISVNSGTICRGVAFTLTPTGTSSYNFSGGSAVVSPTSNTTYTVTGISVDGCTATALSNMTVLISPVISVNSGSLCEGASFTLTPSGASTYTFSNGSAVITPTATASYTVTGTNMLGCTNANLAVSTVVVYSVPVVQVLSTNSAMCIGETSTLSASGAASFTWTGHTPASYIFITPTVATVYTVTGSNASGCSQSMTYTQNVFDCTGIAETKQKINLLSVYPNPNNGTFTIKSEQELDLQIVNTLGQTIRLFSLREDSDNKIEMNELPEGIYFICSRNGEQVFTKKIIVGRY